MSPHQIFLAHWISEYYLSPLFDAVALFLPPGFERKALTFISIPIVFDDFQLPALSLTQKHVFELARKLGSVNLKELEKALGKKKAQAAVSRLANKGLATSHQHNNTGVNNPSSYSWQIRTYDFAGHEVKTTGLVASVPVGEALIGRVLNVSFEIQLLNSSKWKLRPLILSVNPVELPHYQKIHSPSLVVETPAFR